MSIYIVKPNDTVYSIAKSFDNNISTETIIYDNQLIYPYKLAVGQALLINDSAPASSLYSAFSDGYAYPFISPWVLEQTLPFLSSLLIFSYGFTSNGTLVSPTSPDEWMIKAANDYNVKPVLVLTPLDAAGKFNNNLISDVSYSDTAKYRLIEQLKNTLYSKEYSGVDIDFEYILADDRDAFTELVQDISYELKQDGYSVSVALAPKTSATQKGLLYQGKDYPALGAATDHVLLMTYEWGYKYGPPMAVAPINSVKKVVDYALTEIPAEKINLGIPNYGYDWPLPFVPGKTSAVTIGNIEAIQIAISYNAQIQYDTDSQSPFFNYKDGDTEHIVWFEDVRSIQAKFKLITANNLRGMSYWQIMRWWRACFLLQQDTFYLKK